MQTSINIYPWKSNPQTSNLTPKEDREANKRNVHLIIKNPKGHKITRKSKNQKKNEYFISIHNKNIVGNSGEHISTRTLCNTPWDPPSYATSTYHPPPLPKDSPHPKRPNVTSLHAHTHTHTHQYTPSPASL